MKVKLRDNFLTIITATYNRANLLRRVFDSLKNQTNFNFEWIIIDDGSTDNTKEIISDFGDSNFSIHPLYLSSMDKGKHRAINRAIPYVNGEVVCILDSDDFLSEIAVDSILVDFKLVRKNDLVVGVSYLKADLNGVIIGRRHSEAMYIGDFFIERYVKKSVGDKFEIWKSSHFLNYSFPEHTGESFFPEGYLWLKITKEYKVLFINKILYYCDYQNDGISSNARKIHMKNPIGMLAYYELLLSKPLNIVDRIKYILIRNIFIEIVEENLGSNIQIFNIKKRLMRIVSRLWRRLYE